MSESAFRPTYAEIDLSALRHNFAQARRQAGEDRQLLAVVKADAYGHGAVPVARTLEDAGADLFGVALVEEGVELREAGIQSPILILGGTYPGQESLLFDFDLTPSLFDLDLAKRLNAMAFKRNCRCKVHLKLDTGMGRIGFRPEELDAALKVLQGMPGVELDGVFSHLALADEPSDPLTDTQVQRFRDSLTSIREAGFNPSRIHISNSAALFTRELPECNVFRPGIVLYGALPSDWFAGQLDLRPVMHVRSQVAQLKEVPAGTGVSYGHRFATERPSLLAAIPIGYADGYNRLLSNCGEMLIRGRRVRVAGTVCMDWTLVDVTDVPGVQVGDAVTLLGNVDGQQVSAEEWAAKVGSISYEVFCRISQRVPRHYLPATEQDS